MIKLQVTLFSTTGKYRPISTLVNVESIEYFKEHKNEVYKRAIENICHNRRTSWNDLKKDGYTQVKFREYDKEKIEQQKKIELLKKIYEQRQQEKK